VHGLPGSVAFRDALLRQEDLFIVSFSPFLDETSIMADLILPDRVSLEEWGDDIPEPGPGYQVVGFQQPVINPLSDFDPQSFPNILLAMAQDLDKDAQSGAELGWGKFDDLLREKSEELRSLNRGSITAASASEFWNSLLQRGGWWDENQTGPQKVDPPGGLYNRLADQAAEPEFSGAGQADGSFNLIPFSHNTLLEGQNAHLPWLQAAPDPLTTITWQTWVEINDGQAKDLGLREGDIVRLESSPGLSILAPVYPSPAVPPGVVSVPLGQGRHAGSEYATGRAGRESSNVMNIVEPSLVEGTGALAWANTRVRVLPTGDSVNVSKLEGQVRAVEVGITTAEQIIQTIGRE
jgi:molybdopterin-containing oxidoreductase family iron-sulfur binding subunit